MTLNDDPRKNDHAIDRMCASIREFGFKIPVLARVHDPGQVAPTDCTASCTETPVTGQSVWNVQPVRIRRAKPVAADTRN